MTIEPWARIRPSQSDATPSQRAGDDRSAALAKSEVDDLRAAVARERERAEALLDQIEHEGCAASHIGERTYNCDATRPCGLCRLRLRAEDARAALAAEAREAALRGALRRLVNVTEQYHSEDVDCSVCHGWRPDEHRPDCDLVIARAALAAEAPAAPEPPPTPKEEP